MPKTLPHNRPNITTAPTVPGSPEYFQNHTLRPILKQQNELLLDLFGHFLQKRKVDLVKLPRAHRRERIAQLLAKDNRLRGLLFGLVVGQFTSEELQIYLAQESMMNRRLTGLLTERLFSQLDHLLA